jgi:hypothetical protein
MLSKAYEGFNPRLEHNRASFEKGVHSVLANETHQGLAAQLSSPAGLDWYRQRPFYRS